MRNAITYVFSDESVSIGVAKSEYLLTELVQVITVTGKRDLFPRKYGRRTPPRARPSVVACGAHDTAAARVGGCPTVSRPCPRSNIPAAAANEILLSY